MAVGDGGARASDADRDRALEILRDASVDGRLSIDTFVSRVDGVLAAQRQDQIVALIADVSTHQSRADRAVRTVANASEFVRRLRWSWRTPWLPPMSLPAESGRAQTIGRSPECDLVLNDPTVSRRHAELRPRPHGWDLVDLGSMNGTRLNGWRLGVAQAVRAGDVVSFGAISFAVADGPAPRVIESVSAARLG